MKPIRFPAGCGRLKSAVGDEEGSSRLRLAVPTPPSPVIQGIESEVEWRSHRDDVARGLAPIGEVEEARADEIARVLWQQRRIQRLTEHLRGIVAREQQPSRFDELTTPVSVNASRLERLENLGAELDRQMVDAYRRLHAEQDLRLRGVPRGPDSTVAVERDSSQRGRVRDGSRRFARSERKHPFRRLS